MADHRAIADAGHTLVSLLGDRMSELITPEQVVLSSPVNSDLANTVRLTLWLFDVQQALPHATPDTATTAGTTSMGDPLRLELSYLLTAHPGKENSSTSETSQTTDVHKVLGRAMQVLHDNAIVEGPDLQGSLSNDDEALRVTALPKTTDQVVSIWNTFQGEAYRTSVPYLVSPVEIESRREEPVERVEHVRFDSTSPVGGPDA